MKEPPVMISTKDLSYISDMFEWNFTAAKTVNHFGSEIVDSDVKKAMEKVCEMHTNICNDLINVLGGVNE